MTQASTFSLDFAAVTDIGCRRSNNEDSFGYDSEQHVYVVCDGMGGTAAGEVASGMAVRTFIEVFGATSADGLESAAVMPVERRLLSSITEANRVVRDAGAANPEFHSMGTTLVCACLDSNRIVIGNVGDSRAYLLRNGICRQITLDHSLLDEQIRSGNMTAEMAAQSNLQSVITRAIGVADHVEPDFFEARLQPDDMVLLASDGLTRYAEPADLATAASDGADLTKICRGLIDHAKERGGADNITCILLRAVEVPPVTPADQVEVYSPAT